MKPPEPVKLKMELFLFSNVAYIFVVTAVMLLMKTITSPIIMGSIFLIIDKSGRPIDLPLIELSCSYF